MCVCQDPGYSFCSLICLSFPLIILFFQTKPNHYLHFSAYVSNVITILAGTPNKIYIEYKNLLVKVIVMTCVFYDM